MVPTLLVIAGVFCLVLLLRIGGAQRALLLRQWPSILAAGAAILLLFRGALWPALVCGGVALALWFFPPSQWKRSRAERSVESAAVEEARRLLGVGPDASEAEIRSAYRAKIAKAHPDLGGRHVDAARLTAARDRLLGKSR